MPDSYQISGYCIASPIGVGRASTVNSLLEGRSGLAPSDYGPPGRSLGEVEEVNGVRLTGSLERYHCRNNCLAELALGDADFLAQVKAARSRYGASRIGVFVGSSTSGMRETEEEYDRALNAGESALPAAFTHEATHRMSALSDFVQARLELTGVSFCIGTACSSSAKVFASAARAIRAGLCDAAVVGGVDTLCRTTLYGFHSLELLSSSPCRPFDADRAGMSIGEAGAFLLIEPDADDGAVSLLGYGESMDSHHMSTPHPEAAGARLAMRTALVRAGLEPSAIDYVNAHGTATPLNDMAEDMAIAAEVGTDVPVASTKGWTGHALGAAGAVESVLSILSLEEGIAFGTLNTDRIDPRVQCHVLTEHRPQRLNTVMSNSFGFGGNNCVLILGRHD